MFKYVVALYLFVCCFSVFANKPNPLESKSFVVSFLHSANPEVLNELSAYRFSKFEAINLQNTIFKATYFPANLSDGEAKDLLNRLPGIQFVQEDSRVYLRSSTPNDTLLSRQWHFNLIKANQAWDLSRGGINRRGDTIVVAVVDDGLHVNHPDFKGNIWINYADIENNGIDDDNNGFIDDHYGWNFMGQNNDISDSTNYNARHGSCVAGIIGAKGNDITGISGILWNVKLMFSNIADTGNNVGINFPLQSDVIRAYDYVLQQRKLYNSSNGKKGAFVVAINSSWGIDGRFANQAPLWCAMYDSLGKAGILTAGATSNNEVDVEVSGDLPSLCTSKHLIMVSSVNKNDGYAKRGYGTISVDLSAPGEAVFTTRAYTAMNQLSGIYGTFSGTSAAAPMVTGAIGLLQTYACEKVLDLIKSDPAKANLLIRRFILEGVDTLPVLVGKNVTTGRLNIFKAMKIMDQYCYGNLNLKQLGVLQKVVIFPNPGNGLLTIESYSPVNSVECFDATGRRIEIAVDNNKIDISGMGAGLYVFRIATVQGVLNLPYIKE